MPKFDNHAKRERQTAWCCGHRNDRWRVIGAAEFPSGLRNCCVCGKPLVFAPKGPRRGKCDGSNSKAQVVKVRPTEIVCSQDPRPDASICSFSFEDDDDGTVELKMPDDPDIGRHMFKVYRRLAGKLSAKGWKFFQREGPRGHYFEAVSPMGKRAQGPQCETLEDALIKLLSQASDIEFEFK